MRLNRLAQIGLIVIVGAVLLWIGLKAFGPKKSNLAQNDANTANATNAPGVTPVSVNSQQSAQGRSHGRGYKARFYIPERTLLTRDMFVDGSLDPADDNDKFVTDFLTEGYSYITANSIPLGQHLKRSDLLGSIRELGVSAAVHDGYRAHVLTLVNKPTLHDIVSIGDYVDVVATFDQVETRVLADGVRVLAVDVYGRDYEKASVAKRGSQSAGPNAPAHPDPNATPVPGQPPVPEGEPAPTPVPQGQQAPPPVRETALTLEVKPEQAAAIALAAASGAVLDYLIQPRPSTLAAPQLTEARVTKAMVAPYALANKRSGSTTSSNNTRTVSTSSSGGGGGGRTRTPIWEPPVPSPTGITPIDITAMSTPKPKTYDIVIYPDGLPPRVNTVPIPK